MPPTADRSRGWMGRLTRLLAGVLGGEANWLSPTDTIAEAWAELGAATPPASWVAGGRRLCVIALATSAITLATVALAGCEMLSGPRDGSLLINAGHVDGEQWLATARRTGDRVCVTVEHGPRHLVSSCTAVEGNEPAPLTGAGGVTGASPTVIDGITAPEVARVVLQTSAGAVEIPVVSLAPLGVNANGYAVAVPETTGSLVVVQLDAAANELHRTDLGP